MNLLSISKAPKEDSNIDWSEMSLGPLGSSLSHSSDRRAERWSLELRYEQHVEIGRTGFEGAVVLRPT